MSYAFAASNVRLSQVLSNVHIWKHRIIYTRKICLRNNCTVCQHCSIIIILLIDITKMCYSCNPAKLNEKITYEIPFTANLKISFWKNQMMLHGIL